MPGFNAVTEHPLNAPATRVVDDFESRLPEGWRWLVNYSIAGNEIWRVVALFASILLALVLGRLVRALLNSASRRLEARSRRVLAVAFRALARATGFAAFVLGLAVGLEFLVLNATVAAVAQVTVSVLVTIAIGYAAYCLVSVADEWLRETSSATSSKLDDMMVPLVSASLRVTVVVMVLVQIATILSDKPVTSIIAGLGVGGLAVGLAAQDTIKNFFGSLMIFSDRPFELGDEIRVDSTGGSVESVGFRSTRLRTVDGFLVTMPNGELANKTITNISKRRNLSRSLNLALPYDLPPEKLERAAAIVKDILRQYDGLPADMPPRVFVNDITPSAINLMVNYWYSPIDWWRFVAFNERVNLEILRRFAAEGISLALPTQAIQLRSDSPPAARADTPPTR